LRSLPQTEQSIDIHCVTRWSKLGMRFSGVPLAALLEGVAPDASAMFVSFVARSERDHSTSLPLSDALALGSLVALSVEGVPLEVSHGGPVRVIVPGRYFYKSLKWLERIELLAEDRPGFWESTAGYHNTGDVWREERYAAPAISRHEANALLARRDISRRDLRSLDARGCDLAGLLAVGSLLRDADFRDARLSGAKFDGANLSNAHFDRADLRACSFRGADVEGADFRGADLRGASLAEASLFGCTFRGGEEGAQGARIDASTSLDSAGLEALAPAELAYVTECFARRFQ
jgi:hypothetical protein